MAEDSGERAPLLRAQSAPSAAGYQTRRARRAHFQDDRRLSDSREMEHSVEEDGLVGERELWEAYQTKKKRMASIVSIASRVSKACIDAAGYKFPSLCLAVLRAGTVLYLCIACRPTTCTVHIPLVFLVLFNIIAWKRL